MGVSNQDQLRWKTEEHTPGVGEVDGKEPNEDNSHPALRFVETLVEIPVILVETLNGSNDDVTEEHANGTDNQEGLTTKLVKPKDGGHGEDNLQDTGHTSSQESLLGGGETETLEDLGRIVEDGVDTGELLANHSSAAQEQTLQHVGGK